MTARVKRVVKARSFMSRRIVSNEWRRGGKERKEVDRDVKRKIMY